MGIVKKASADSVAAVMERIRQEKPEHWPHGLHPGLFDQGDLYGIHKSASEPPIGFVGWQVRKVGQQKVGFYAVGVLPEYRGQGVAKKMVSDLISKKASQVDRVAAFIVAGNVPSEKLATKLGIPVLQKVASPGRIASWAARQPRWAQALGSGVATAGMADPLMHRDKGLMFGATTGRDYDGYAWVDALKNVLAGSTAIMGKNPATKILGPAFGLATTGGFKGVREMGRANDLRLAGLQTENTKNDLTAAGLRQARELAETAQGLPQATGLPPWALLGGAGLLTAGLGYGAHRLSQTIADKADAPITLQTNEGGRMRVTLPTSSPDDAETVLDLPFNKNVTFSDAQLKRLAIDTRRRLRNESRSRKQTFREKRDQDGEEDQ